MFWRKGKEVVGIYVLWMGLIWNKMGIGNDLGEEEVEVGYGCGLGIWMWDFSG